MPNPGDPLDQLIRGIFAKWESLRATTFAGINGPWRQEKPATTAGHPYAIVKDDGCFKTNQTCVSELFDSEIEFRVYDKSPELAAEQIAKVDGVFSSMSLSLTTVGVNVIGVRLVGSAYVKPDEAIWYGGLRYRFQLSRSLIS